MPERLKEDCGKELDIIILGMSAQAVIGKLSKDKQILVDPRIVFAIEKGNNVQIIFHPFIDSPDKIVILSANFLYAPSMELARDYLTHLSGIEIVSEIKQ